MKLLVTYRLLGSVDNPELTKEFHSDAEFEEWRAAQVNVLIVSVIEIRSVGGKL